MEAAVLNRPGAELWKLGTRQEWASWLSSLASWDWFVTVTFSDLVTPPGAHHFFKRYLIMIENALNVCSVEEPKQSNGFGYVEQAQRSFPRIKVKAFRADEYGERQGRLHMHALIAGVKSLRRYCGTALPAGQWGKKCCFVHAWPCGYARVLDYDSSLGAGYYISKYTVKLCGDWALYGFGK